MKRICFTRNQIKWIGAITMVLDHIAVIFLKGQGEHGFYTLLRIIGRISFPLFAFLLVQGFLTTSNRKKYIMRMGIFAFLSEIPFDWAFYGKIWYPQGQNVMFTLLLGLLMLYILEEAAYYNVLVQYIVLIGFSVLGTILRTDYSWFGILLIGILYMTRYQPIQNRLLFCGFLFCLYGGLELGGMLAFPFMAWYEEKQKKKMGEGEKKTVFLRKYSFYFFYPIHLILLKGLWILTMGI